MLAGLFLVERERLFTGQAPGQPVVDFERRGEDTAVIARWRQFLDVDDAAGSHQTPRIGDQGAVVAE